MKSNVNGDTRETASIASKIKWGILGTANIGVKHVIPAIIAGQRGVVFGIASRDAGRATNTAARFGIARSYGSYQALLDDPEIEAVYNPLPNHLHVEWTVKALDAGKHVLCEKPIALAAQKGRLPAPRCLIQLIFTDFATHRVGPSRRMDFRPTAQTPPVWVALR